MPNTDKENEVVPTIAILLFIFVITTVAGFLCGMDYGKHLEKSKMYDELKQKHDTKTKDQ